jgi:hypothetical protein
VIVEKRRKVTGEEKAEQWWAAMKIEMNIAEQWWAAMKIEMNIGKEKNKERSVESETIEEQKNCNWGKREKRRIELNRENKITADNNSEQRWKQREGREHRGEE